MQLSFVDLFYMGPAVNTIIENLSSCPFMDILALRCTCKEINGLIKKQGNFRAWHNYSIQHIYEPKYAEFTLQVGCEIINNIIDKIAPQNDKTGPIIKYTDSLTNHIVMSSHYTEEIIQKIIISTLNIEYIAIAPSIKLLLDSYCLDLGKKHKLEIFLHIYTMT